MNMNVESKPGDPLSPYEALLRLSPTQRKVVEAVANPTLFGFKDIAFFVGISENSLKVHMHKIYNRMPWCLRSPRILAIWAIENAEELGFKIERIDWKEKIPPTKRTCKHCQTFFIDIRKVRICPDCRITHKTRSLEKRFIQSFIGRRNRA